MSNTQNTTQFPAVTALRDQLAKLAVRVSEITSIGAEDDAEISQLEEAFQRPDVIPFGDLEDGAAGVRNEWKRIVTDVRAWISEIRGTTERTVYGSSGSVTTRRTRAISDEDLRTGFSETGRELAAEMDGLVDDANDVLVRIEQRSEDRIRVFAEQMGDPVLRAIILAAELVDESVREAEKRNNPSDPPDRFTRRHLIDAYTARCSRFNVEERIDFDKFGETIAEFRKRQGNKPRMAA